MDKDQRTRVLVLIDWYLPGYKAGGPIQSVANLVAHLSDKISFSIVTRDSDFGEDAPYSNISADQWVEDGEHARIYYLSAGNQNLKGLKKLIDPNEYDYIYLNSVFSYKFAILPLLAFNSSPAQIVLAPRGMLGKGALEIKSLKKKLFLKAAQFPGLYDKVLWQATNAEEHSEILSLFGDKARVKVASNIPASVPDQIQVKEKKKGELKLVFLSRISEKKNLLGLIELLEDLRVEGTISLDLYGPIEDQDYWGKCEQRIEELPDTIKVMYRGAIEQSKIRETLSHYHFFTLLTRHENFGHAIFEALAAGCPLIISDTTPWRDLETKNIGWDIALNDKAGFHKAIAACLAMGQEEYSEMSQGTHLYAQDYIQHDSAVDQSRNLFKD